MYSMTIPKVDLKLCGSSRGQMVPFGDDNEVAASPKSRIIVVSPFLHVSTLRHDLKNSVNNTTRPVPIEIIPPTPPPCKIPSPSYEPLFPLIKRLPTPKRTRPKLTNAKTTIELQEIPCYMKPKPHRCKKCFGKRGVPHTRTHSRAIIRAKGRPSSPIVTSKSKTGIDLKLIDNLTEPQLKPVKLMMPLTTWSPYFLKTPEVLLDAIVQASNTIIIPLYPFPIVKNVEKVAQEASSVYLTDKKVSKAPRMPPPTPQEQGLTQNEFIEMLNLQRKEKVVQKVDRSIGEAILLKYKPPQGFKRFFIANQLPFSSERGVQLLLKGRALGKCSNADKAIQRYEKNCGIPSLRFRLRKRKNFKKTPLKEPIGTGFCHEITFRKKQNAGKYISFEPDFEEFNKEVEEVMPSLTKAVEDDEDEVEEKMPVLTSLVEEIETEDESESEPSDKMTPISQFYSMMEDSETEEEASDVEILPISQFYSMVVEDSEIEEEEEEELKTKREDNWN